MYIENDLKGISYGQSISRNAVTWYKIFGNPPKIPYSSTLEIKNSSTKLKTLLKLYILQIREKAGGLLEKHMSILLSETDGEVNRIIAQQLFSLSTVSTIAKPVCFTSIYRVYHS